MVLKSGSSIRSGMIFVSRIMFLVSGIRVGVGMMDEYRVVISVFCFLFFL